MRIFKIPVSYEVYGTVEIEANTLKEAMKYAQENIDDLPLADEPQYIDDSYEIGELEVAELINGVA